MKKLWNILFAAVLCITLGLGFFNFSQRGVGVIPAYQASIYVPTGSALGDVLVFNGTTWTRLAGGTAKDRLSTNGTATVPYWTSSVNASNLDTGTVPRALMTSINASALDTGTVSSARLGPSGGNVTSILGGYGAMVFGCEVNSTMLQAAYDAKTLLGPLIQICDGTDDEVQVEAAIAAVTNHAGAAASCSVGAIGPALYFHENLDIPASQNFLLDLSKTTINVNTSNTTVQVIIDSWRNSTFKFGMVAGTTTGTRPLVLLQPVNQVPYDHVAVGNNGIFSFQGIAKNGNLNQGTAFSINTTGAAEYGVFWNDIYIGDMPYWGTGFSTTGTNNVTGNRIYIQNSYHCTTAMSLGANFDGNIVECPASVLDTTCLSLSGSGNEIKISSPTNYAPTTGVVFNSGAVDNLVTLNKTMKGSTITDSSGNKTNKILPVIQNSGTATLLINTGDIIVAHNLGATPSRVLVAMTSNPGLAVSTWVDTYTSANFTIHTSTNVTTATTFDWKAQLGGE